MKKKIVSLLLTAALALSLLPMGALAASNTVFLDGYASDDAVIESSAAFSQLAVSGEGLNKYADVSMGDYWTVPAYEADGAVTVTLTANQEEMDILMLDAYTVTYDASKNYYDVSDERAGFFEGNVMEYTENGYKVAGSIRDYEEGRLDGGMLVYESGAALTLDKPGIYYIITRYEAIAGACVAFVRVNGGESSGEKHFTDVDENAYYAPAVKWAVENRVTDGTSDTTFSPKDTCTRGQVVTFLWRAMGRPEPGATKNKFKDVNANDYYYKAVLWAVENGITDGTSDTEFSPAQTCSNAHILTFLWRTLDCPGGTEGETWYSAAAAWAEREALTKDTAAAGAITGDCPRADVVTFLYRELAK